MWKMSTPVKDHLLDQINGMNKTWVKHYDPDNNQFKHYESPLHKIN